MASKGKKTIQGKLTAILCADVVGYSRLMRKYKYSECKAGERNNGSYSYNYASRA